MLYGRYKFYGLILANWHLASRVTSKLDFLATKATNAIDRIFKYNVKKGRIAYFV